MLSRPLALGLVVAACVVAAGGGAYIATLQHERSDAAMAASPVAGAGPAAVAQAAAPQARVDFTPAAQPGAAVQARGAAPAPVSSPDDVAPAPVRPGEPPTVSARSAGKVHARQSGHGSTRPAENVERSAAASAPAQASAPGDDTPAASQPAAAAPATPQQAAAPIPAPTDPLPAREQSRPEPQKTWQELTVPADAVIGLQLETPLSSDTARVEDRVDARVTRDVRVDGQVAIPAGSHVIGAVMMVERGGKIRERARLGIRFNTLVLPDATRLALSTDTVYREGESPASSSSAKIGGAAIGGAILGTILGGGKGAVIGGGIGAAGGTAAAMAGNRRPVVLPVGTPLNVRTQSPVSVAVEK